MTGSGKLHFPSEVAIAWLLAASLSFVAVRIAAADDTPAAVPAPAATTVQQGPETAAPAPAPSFPAQPPPAAKPGFFDEFGRWWKKGIADFNANMKDARQKADDFNKQQSAAAKDAAAATQEAMKNAAAATKDAAAAVVHLPSTRVIEIHETCANAANGAPDCQSAATNVCRGKGFSTGQPLDVVTANKCKASLWISGQVPAENECPIETVLLRVVCQ